MSLINLAVFILIAGLTYRRANQEKEAGKSGIAWMIVSIVFGVLAVIWLADLIF